MTADQTQALAALLHDAEILHGDGFHHYDCSDLAVRLIEQGVGILPDPSTQWRNRDGQTITVNLPYPLPDPGEFAPFQHPQPDPASRELTRWWERMEDRLEAMPSGPDRMQALVDMNAMILDYRDALRAATPTPPDAPVPQPTPDEERDAVLAERLDWEAEQEAKATPPDALASAITSAGIECWHRETSVWLDADRAAEMIAAALEPQP